VHHLVEAALAEESVDQLGVADVPFRQPVVVTLEERRHVGAFADRVVEIVEVVQHRHAVSAVEQATGEM
jgi:hypothetical protein